MDYYGQTTSDAKTEVNYYGQTKSDDAVVDAGAKDVMRLSGSKPMLKAPHVGADAVVDAGAKDEMRLSGSKPMLKAPHVGADAIINAAVAKQSVALHLEEKEEFSPEREPKVIPDDIMTAKVEKLSVVRGSSSVPVFKPHGAPELWWVYVGLLTLSAHCNCFYGPGQLIVRF